MYLNHLSSFWGPPHMAALILSLVTIAGSVAGSHGWNLF
jgi:hypothetical protein